MDVAQQNAPALRLKASLHPFTLLQLDTQDLSIIEGDLSQRLARAPELLKNAPIIVQLPKQPIAVEWAQDLISMLKSLGFIPVGLRCEQNQHPLAEHLQLPLFADSVNKSSAAKQASDAPEKAPIDKNVIAKTTKVVKAVRSGQQAVNPNGDLVVMGNVGQGAEVLASGNIHIHGSLYGRALAGIQGDQSAVISCQKLQSELLAIAGHYQVSDDQDSEHFQKTCIITLKGEQIEIQSS